MGISVKSEGSTRTEGEGIVQSFIEEHFPKDFQAWMNIELAVSGGGRQLHQMELDVVLFHPKLGLMLGEIKDWRIEQIAEITKQYVRLENGSSQSNPSSSLQQKFYSIRTKLASRREFGDGRRVKMPIHWLVIFPFISREEWRQHFDGWGIKDEDVGLPENVLIFCDDLVPGGDLADSERIVERLDRARSVRFSFDLPGSTIEKLDQVFRGYVSERAPDIAILKESDIIASVRDMVARGGRSQQGAERVIKLFKEPSRRVVELLQLPSTPHPLPKNCIVYELNEVTHLTTIHHAGVIYPVYCGSLEETAAWIDRSAQSVIAIDRKTGRLALTHESGGDSEPSVSTQLAISSENTPLFSRLEGFSLEDMNLRRIERRFLESIDERTEPDEIEEVLSDLSDAKLAKLLASMVSFLRQKKNEEALAAYSLYIDEAVDAAKEPILETEALDDDVNSDVVCVLDDLSPEHIASLFAPDRFQEWMLFLHPKQKEIVDCDSEKPMLIKGISGSGKTCILVHRARRLARNNPEAKICLLTLNRALAALLKQLVSGLCTVEEQECIEVWAYYDLFKRILNKIGAGDYFETYATTLHGQDHMQKVLNQVDANACVNEFDPRSNETLHDTWHDFWWQRDDQLREAKDRISSYLRDNQLTIDVPAYMREEFQLIRTAFPITSRQERYADFQRDGRAIRFLDTANRPHRRDTLYLLKRYEEYMIAGGMLDEEGLSQILMCRSIRERLGNLPDELRIDHLLVDEFQDFSTAEINVLKQLPRANINAFCAAGDTTQKVFVKDLRMMATSLVAGSTRMFSIRQNFRNSRQILEAASKLNAHYGEIARKQGVDIEVIDPTFATRETARPIAYQVDHEISVAWELAQEWIGGQNVEPWSVCIATASPRKVSVDEILETRPKDLAADMISGDYMRRRGHMVVGTIAEVKGFEFSMIIIVGCSSSMFPNNSLPEAEAWRDALRLYVAMTRGRDQVALLYSEEPSTCLDLMRDSLEWQKRDAVTILKRRPKKSSPKAKKPRMRSKSGEARVFDLHKYGLPQDLSGRLYHAGFEALSELSKASDSELLKIRNVGRKHVKLIREALDAYENAP
jgi:superfamily I DNA/RNA helicase